MTIMCTDWLRIHDARFIFTCFSESMLTELLLLYMRVSLYDHDLYRLEHVVVIIASPHVVPIFIVTPSPFVTFHALLQVFTFLIWPIRLKVIQTTVFPCKASLLTFASFCRMCYTFVMQVNTGCKVCSPLCLLRRFDTAYAMFRSNTKVPFDIEYQHRLSFRSIRLLSRLLPLRSCAVI